MFVGDRTAIPRTHVDYWPQASYRGPIDPDERVQISVWLHAGAGASIDIARAEALGALLPRDRTYEQRRALRERTRAPAAVVERVASYCRTFGLDVLRMNWRSIDLHGPLGAFIEAFDADVAIFSDALGRPFRTRRGPLSIEADLAPHVCGVFGFSQWPRAQRLGQLQRHTTPLPLAQLAARYAFPESTGRAQTIGIIQMGGEFRVDDFTRCMSAQGISRAAPIVKRIDDAPDAHREATTQDLESAIDAQIAAAIAPDATVVIYRGSDSERAFLDAVRTALFDEEHAPSILSISYGWPEPLWTPAAIDIMNDLFAVASLLGASVFCASGDNGAELDAAGDAHVLFPASSPFVHGCGASSIAGTDADTETAWERTGGGYSERFAAPDWQRSANGKGRGVPDVAAQQYPGYCIYLDGVELAAGGTSAVAPMWSGLIARINERIGNRAGFFAPLLYRTADTCTNMLEGTNGRYNAGPGWNACTGLGVPNARLLEAALRG